VTFLEFINIRGRNFPLKKKAPDRLHECYDCEGCILEGICDKYEEVDFKKKIMSRKEGDL
jgi:hypothetical protein